MDQPAPASTSTPQSIPAWHLYGEASAFPDVLHIELITDRAAGLDWQIAAHRHQQLHQFFLVQDGETRISLDGKTFAEKPPFLLNVPAGVVHGFAFAAGTKGWVLTVPVPTMPDLLDFAKTDEMPLGQATVLPVTAEMTALFGLIDQEHGSSHAGRSQMLRALATQLACHVLRNAETGTRTGKNSPDPRFQSFLALLDLHLRDKWRLRDYAGKIGVSERHLGRICRAATGRPAAEIIEAATIRESCRLLAYTRASVATVGYGLGFEDPSYFSRAFRRRMGLSPAAYRAGFDRG
jgi:AraC family transcriptional regulator, transcriptional activator of pobA